MIFMQEFKMLTTCNWIKQFHMKMYFWGICELRSLVWMDDVLNNSHGHIFGAKININQSILYCQRKWQFSTLFSALTMKDCILCQSLIWDTHINIHEGYVTTCCKWFDWSSGHVCTCSTISMSTNHKPNPHTMTYDENSPLHTHSMYASATCSQSLLHSFLKTKKTRNLKL